MKFFSENFPLVKVHIHVHVHSACDALNSEVLTASCCVHVNSHGSCNRLFGLKEKVERHTCNYGPQTTDFLLLPSLGTSTLDTLECTSNFWTSYKRSVLMRIDALWRVYTINFAHNLAAVHGEWHSVVVLYKEGKVQSCQGFMKEWFDRHHTNKSSLYWESFGKGWRKHAVSVCSGYPRKVFQSLPLCAFVSLAACQWRRGWSSCRLHPWGGERSPTNTCRSNYRVTPT